MTIQGLIEKVTSGRARFVWYGLPLVQWAVMVFLVRGVGRYSPPDFGGAEPIANHLAALEILASGRTAMTFHATGYSYLIAAVYAVLPQVPLSVLAVQGLLLVVMVPTTARIAERLGGELAGRCAMILAGTYYAFPYFAATFTGVFPVYLAMTGAIALSFPLLERSSAARSAAVGGLLGIAVCCRPNMALAGVVVFGSIWWASRSFGAALRRAAPIAAVSLCMLVAMTWANPPEPGQFVRGSQGMYRSILEGTYQFQDRWWDWEPYGDEVVMSKFWDHVRRLEAESGKPMVHPDTQALLRRDAMKRIRELPLNTLKKAAISSVRIWILVPTHLDRISIEVVFALLEGVLLVLAVGGMVVSRRRGAPWYVGVGLMVIVTVGHLVMHVEPRYSLPGRAIEVAFIGVALSWLVARRSNVTRPALTASEVAP